MPYPYVTLDVFTDVAFGGNPLAVVSDGRGLDGETMQQIASEFGYSETTFILPPANPAHTAQVRIFTPTREVPFAGHPNIGTALAVAWEGKCLGRAVTDTIVFEEEAGLVSIAIARDRRGNADRATLVAPQRLSTGPQVDPAIIAACCALPVDKVDTSAHAPMLASVGLGFIEARLTDRAALAAAQPDIAAFRTHAAAMPVPDILVYVPSDSDGSDYDVRVFAPLDGVMEDPATGSANAALIGLLAQIDQRNDCTLDLRIAQGADMGRPSLLHGTARKVFGTVEEIQIGGGAVRMMSGIVHLN